jgi:hypothetical protein
MTMHQHFTILSFHLNMCIYSNKWDLFRHFNNKYCFQDPESLHSSRNITFLNSVHITNIKLLWNVHDSIYSAFQVYHWSLLASKQFQIRITSNNSWIFDAWYKFGSMFKNCSKNLSVLNCPNSNLAQQNLINWFTHHFSAIFLFKTRNCFNKYCKCAKKSYIKRITIYLYKFYKLYYM